MADYQSTIELKAVTRDIDRKLNAVKKNLKGVSTQVRKAQTSFKKMSASSVSSLKRLDSKVKSSKLAIAGFAASFALLAGKGVSAFKAWEDGLNQIATLGVKTMDTVKTNLKALRREYGITGKEATKGYYDIVSAGAKAGKQAMDQLTAATQLAKAGNTDLDKAVKIVTSGVKVFGEQGETAQSIIDKLFLAVKYGKTTVAELGNQFGLVAPLMKTAGLGMSDYAAAMAAITAGSIETSVATTGLKAIMSNIIKVTPKAAKAAARLGIDFSVAALKAKGFVGFMQEIREKTGGSAVEIGKLFESIEAINAVAVLTSNAGIADLIRNFDAMKDSAGTVKGAMDIIKKSFSFNWSVLGQQMNIMSESLGSVLVPNLIAFASALGPVVELISALILQYPGVVKLTAAVTAFALAWSFVGLKTSLILTAVITALTFLSKKFDLFADGGAHAFNVLNDHIVRFFILLKRTKIGEALSSAFNFVAEVVGQISWESFKKSMTESWKLIQTQWNKKGTDGLELSLGEKLISITSFIFAPLLDGVKAAFKTAWTLVTDWWNGTEDTKGAATVLAGGLLTASFVFSDMLKGVQTAFDAAWETVKTWWTTFDWKDYTLSVKEVSAKIKVIVSSTTASVEEAWIVVKDWWTTLDWSDKTLIAKNVYAKIKVIVSSTTASVLEAWAVVKDWWTTLDWSDKTLLAKNVAAKIKVIVSSTTASVEEAWIVVKDWWTTLDWSDKTLIAKNVYAKIKVIVSSTTASVLEAWTVVKDWWTTLDWSDKTLLAKNVAAKIKVIVSSTTASVLEAWTVVKDWWTTLDWSDKTLIAKNVYAKIKVIVSSTTASVLEAWTVVKDWWTTLDWSDKTLLAKNVAAKIKVIVSSTTASVLEAWTVVKDWWTTLDWSDKTLLAKNVAAKIKVIVSSTTASVLEAWTVVKDWWTTLDWSDKTLLAKNVAAKIKVIVSSTTASVLEAWTVVKDWWTTLDWSDKTLLAKNVAAKIKVIVSSTTASVEEAWIVVKDWWTTLDWSGKTLTAKSVAAKIKVIVSSTTASVEEAWTVVKDWWSTIDWTDKKLAIKDIYAKVKVKLSIFFGEKDDNGDTTFDRLVKKISTTWTATKDKIVALDWSVDLGDVVKDAVKKVYYWFVWLKDVLVGRSVVPDTVKLINSEFDKIDTAAVEEKVSAMQLAFQGLKDLFNSGSQYNLNFDSKGGEAEATTLDKVFGLLHIVVADLTQKFILLNAIIAEGPTVARTISRLDELRKALRLLNAATKDDLGDVGTDKSTTTRALTDYSRRRLLWINNEIAALKTLGVEQNRISIRELESEFNQVNRALIDADAVPQKRGLIGRFLYGDDFTLNSKSEKFFAFFRRLDDILSSIGTKLHVAAQNLDVFAVKAEALKPITLEFKASVLLDDALRTLTDTEVIKGKTGTTLVNLLARIASAKAGSDVDELVKVMVEYEEAVTADQKALDQMVKAEKAVVEARLAQAKALKDLKTFLSEQTTKIQELLKPATPDAEVVPRSGKPPKPPTSVIGDVKLTTGKVSAATKALGQIYRALATTVAWVSATTVNSFTKMANFMKAIPGVEALKNAGVGAIKATGIIKAVGFILKKILFPLVIIYDLYKGFTDLGRIGEVTGMNTVASQAQEKLIDLAKEKLAGLLEAEELDTAAIELQKEVIKGLEAHQSALLEAAGLTTGTRVMSAVSNALGNFFSSFLHLAGIITEWFGLDETTGVLKNADFAKDFSKFFDAIGTLASAIKRFFDKSGTSTLIDWLASTGLSIVINSISGIVDIIYEISHMFDAISRGDLGDIWKHLTRVFDTIVNYILSGIWGFDDFDVAEAKDQRRYDVIDTNDDLQDARAKEAEELIKLNDIVDKNSEAYQTQQQKLAEASAAVVIFTELLTAAKKSQLDAGDDVSFTREDEVVTVEIAPTSSGVFDHLNNTQDNLNPKLQFATGGSVSGNGTGTSDSIPAMLSNGEFVINAKATKQNRALLEQINSGNIAKFAHGGEAGGSLFDNIKGTASEYTSSFIENQLENLSGYQVPGRVMGFFGGLLSAADGLMSAVMPKVNSMFTALFNSEVPQTRATNLVRDKAEPQVYDYLGRYGDDVVDQLAVSKGLSYIPGVGTILALANAASIPMELLQGYSKSQRVLGRYRKLPNFANNFLEGFEGASSPTDYFRILTGGKSISRALIDTVTSFFSNDDNEHRLNRYGKEYASGGSVSGSGSGTSDSIPAMLSNGEFVINAKAAQGNRKLLEMINSGNIQGFADGGKVGEFYDYTAKQTGYKTDSFGNTVGDLTDIIDLSKIKKMIDTLDKGTNEYKKLIRLYDDANKATRGLTYEEAALRGTVADLNKAVLGSSLATEELGLQSTQTAASVRALGEDAGDVSADMKALQGEWTGTFKSFTGPLKDAARNATDFGDALKQGVKGLLQTISSKLLDRALQPIEDAMDAVFNKMFGTVTPEMGADAAHAMYVKIVGKDPVAPTVGKVLSAKGNPHDGTVRAVEDSTRAIIEGTESNVNVMGGIFGEGGLFSGFGDAFSGLFSGGGASGGSGGGFGGMISSFIGGLFGVPMSRGGIVPKLGQQPQYFSGGGFARGTDTVPAMLTPGEMVLNAGQQAALGGNTTYVTNSIEVSGNMDERAMQQIRNIIQNSPNQVNAASRRGERSTSGLKTNNGR